MVTKGASKKKKFSSKKKELSFQAKNLLFLGATLIFFFLIIFLLSRITGNSITGNNVLDTIFSGWKEGTWGESTDLIIAKSLFSLIIVCLIWASLSVAHFPPYPALRAIIAISAGILATVYLTPSDVFTALTGYTTLGIVLSFVLPFIILIFFSVMLISNPNANRISVPTLVIEVFIWIFFLVILGYRIIEGISSGKLELGLNLTIIIMLAIFSISALILIFNKTFRNWIWKLSLQLKKYQNRNLTQDAASAILLKEELDRVQSNARKKNKK